MVKRWFLVGGILLLASLLLIGCGVPKEDYEAVVAEKDSALAELQSVKSQLNSTQAEVSDLKAEVSDLNSKLEESQTEYQGFKSDVTSLWASLLKKQELGNQVIKHEGNAYKEETPEVLLEDVTIFKSFDPLVEAIGDGELSRLWGETWPSGSREQSEREKSLWLWFDPYSRFIDRLSSLLESDINKLQAVLAD